MVENGKKSMMERIDWKLVHKKEEAILDENINKGLPFDFTDDFVQYLRDKPKKSIPPKKKS